MTKRGSLPFLEGLQNLATFIHTLNKYYVSVILINEMENADNM